MAEMINRVVLVGRVTKDLELRKTRSGTSVVYFTLAVNRSSKKSDQPDVDFVNCVVWSKAAENLVKYQGKGSLLGVEGRIQTRNYENQRGQKVYVTEVVASSIAFLESRKNGRGNDGYQQRTANPYDFNDELNLSPDDLPF